MDHIRPFEFENDHCIYAKLNNKKNIFYGCIRTCKQKNEILLLLRKLENLKFLDLRKNKICSMPDMHFENLTHLDLASNYLTEVPSWVKNNNIEFLNLGVNNLKLIRRRGLIQLTIFLHIKMLLYFLLNQHFLR